MIEKLRSHLHKNEKGFTLIELLVVIAIIAILVTIVLVAINPLARIQEAQQKDGQSRVRQTATGVEACLTNYLGNTSGATAITAAAYCSTAANLTGAGTYLKVIPANTAICQGAAASTDDDKIAIYTSAKYGNHWYVYKTANASGGGTNAPGAVYDFGTGATAPTCATALAG